MKRRLTNAFDRMTMPQACSDRIERMLEAELEIRGDKREREGYRVPGRPDQTPLWKNIAMAAASLALVVTVGGMGIWVMARGGLRPSGFGTVSQTEANWEEIRATSPSQKTETVVSGDYAYFENEDGSLTITKYNGTAAEVVIPAQIDGKAVRVLGGHEGDDFGVFRNNTEIKSVFVADSVNLIDDSTFSGCTNLESVTVPASVTGIGHCAFESCPSLKAVYFEGNAPAVGNDVFTETPDVTVYYLKGTTGWEETWQGCPTRLLGGGEDSSDLETLCKESQVALIGVMLENRKFYAHDYEKELSIEEYCAAFTETCGVATTVPRFAVVDMDSDGVYEVILAISINVEGVEYSQGNVVLRYQEGKVHGYLLYQREMFDLKQDGTFNKSVSSLPNSAGVLEFDGDYVGTREVESSQEQQDAKPGARWFVYPCERVDAVLASFENAQPDPEGDGTYLPYYELMRGYAVGRHTDSWDLLCQGMEANGYHWSVSEGVLTVYFPEMPGCMLYAYPTDIDGVGELGFYYCTEDREYELKVTELNTSVPRYFVDVDWWGEGTEVASLEELDAYFGQYREKVNTRESLAVQTVAELFSNAYFSIDAQSMQTYLTADYAKRLELYSGSPEYQVVNIKGVPEEVKQVGDVVTVWVEFRETPEADSYSYLTLELVKQVLDWKVQSYGLEK